MRAEWQPAYSSTRDLMLGGIQRSSGSHFSGIKAQRDRRAMTAVEGGKEFSGAINQNIDGAEFVATPYFPNLEGLSLNNKSA